MTSEEETVNMRGQEDNAVRMAGYLDKRGKMKLVSTWKRYWFVLKDQLLLYYKSQLECLNLSACRGSLNMGLASCVRPGAHRGPPANGSQGYTIEVVTRTQVITLRTRERGLQEQWLKALLESMALPNISTPLRTSGGPIHFRYSLDNLPTVEELETEDAVKEKQKTLPHRTSVTRQDSVLKRIKRIGGHSYGGSLETILKSQTNNNMTPQRSPQQPKIPRIRAVDRMLGSQCKEEQKEDENAGGREERKCLNGQESTAVPISKNQSIDFVGEEYLNDSTKLVLKDEVSKTGARVQSKCNNVMLKIPMVTTSDSKDSGDNKSNQETEASGATRKENQNHENFNVASIEDAKNCTINFLENQRHISFLENEGIFVENKLYEKTKEINGKDVKHEVVNKLYEKARLEEKDNQYDSEEELSGFPQINNVPEDEKMYEVVSECVDAEIQGQKDGEGSEDNEEDEYYCSYDQVSTMHLLSDQRNGSSPEPDLPPRPSVGSNDSGQYKQQATKTEDEDEDYSVYYESTESYNTITSPSKLLTSGGDGPHSEKKESKLHGKIKLKKKKLPSKESVTSEDGRSNSKNKRKMSFLRRMLKHYRKKPESTSKALVTSDNHVSSDEPVYESVDYSAPMVKHEDNEEKQSAPAARGNSPNIPEKEMHKEKLFGTKSLLTEQALLELKMKLKDRDDATQTTSAAPTNEDNEGYECISLDEVPERKPIPTPRPDKEKFNQDNKDFMVEASRYRCNDSINRANKPPSLPPRKVARPLSPWHDVPKNNSPVYGNFQDLGITVEDKKEDMLQETSEPTIEKQSAPKDCEWDQEFQDELLGTPRGFVYIQNKWKAVEKSVEWNRDQQGTKGKSLIQHSPQKERFPENCNITEEIKVKHMRSPSSDSAGSEIVSHEYKNEPVLVANACSSDIYSDIHKEHPSAKTIIKSLNSQTEKITHKASELSNGDDKNDLHCAVDKTKKVNNIELKLGNAKTEHHDISDDRILNHGDSNQNFNINTTHHKDHSDDTIVTLRKSQIFTIPMCNKHQVLFNKIDNCHTVVSSENESLSSSQPHIEIHAKEIKGETEDKTYSSSDCSNTTANFSAQQEIETPSNAPYNQNMLKSETIKNLSHRTVGYEETGDIMPRLNRHSDELNLLLAQLAEITSAPLLPQGAATSLIDLPEGRKPKPQTDQSSQHGPAQPELFVLGPIRRRRHSDPDYDVPRPHGSLLHLLAPNRMSSLSSGQSQSGQESDVIEATHFFGEADLTSNSDRSSLNLRHSVISEVDDQSDTSYYVSMAPDSLEVPLNRDV